MLEAIIGTIIGFALFNEVLAELKAQNHKVHDKLNLMLDYYLDRRYEKAASIMKEINKENPKNELFRNLWFLVEDKFGIFVDCLTAPLYLEKGYRDSAELRFQRAFAQQEEVVKYLKNTRFPRKYRSLFEKMLIVEERALKEIDSTSYEFRKSNFSLN